MEVKCTPRRLLLILTKRLNHAAMRFEASDPEIKVGLDLSKADVLTLITFQHGVENRKCYDFHQYKCF